MTDTPAPTEAGEAFLALGRFVTDCLAERGLLTDPDVRVALPAALDRVPRWDAHRTAEFPTDLFADADTPLELLQLLAGAASVCWDAGPVGVFRSEQAGALCDAALSRLVDMGWA